MEKLQLNLENGKAVDNPNYGKIVKSPDGRLMCHICGKLFNKLGSHVYYTHKMTAYEYKKIFGLETGKGLMSLPLHLKCRDNVMLHYDKCISENLVKRGAGTRFNKGDKGRTRDKLSEQTRASLIEHINGVRNERNAKQRAM